MNVGDCANVTVSVNASAGVSLSERESLLAACSNGLRGMRM